MTGPRARAGLLVALAGFASSAACGSTPTTSTSTTSATGSGGGGARPSGSSSASAGGGGTTSSSAGPGGAGPSSTTTSTGSGGGSGGSTTTTSSGSGGAGCLVPAQLSGDAAWSASAGPAGDQIGDGVAFDAAGNVLVGGVFAETLDLGCGALLSPGGTRAFVAKLDPTGSCVWSKAIGGDGQDYRGASLAVDAAGDAVLVGRLTAGGAHDLFVTKLDAAGGTLWSKAIAAAGDQEADAVTVDASGAVILAGRMEGTLDLGGSCAPLTAPAGAFLGFAAKLDAAGACVWSKAWSAGEPHAVRADPLGDIVIAGAYFGATDLGCGPLGYTGGGALADAFVARLDASGACLWSKGYGDAASQGGAGRGVALDAAGDVFVTFESDGDVDLGCGPLVNPGARVAVVAKLDPGGHCLWSRGFGDTGAALPYGVASDCAGNVTVVGYADGTLDFGCGAIATQPSTNAFVTRLGPAGECRWSHLYLDAGGSSARAVATAADGSVAVAGLFHSSVDIGGATHTTGGYENVFVARLAP